MTKENGFQFFPPKNYSIQKSLRELKQQPGEYWERQGEAMAMNLLDYVWKNVPAYRLFLEQKGFDRKQIKTIEDFRLLPATDKDSYLRAYSLADLIPNGDMSRITTVSATSGSSGEPFFFPRGEEQDRQYRYVAELFLKNQFGLSRRKKTLGVIGFGLGIWIGGIFTYKNFNRIAASGSYNLALVPVGPSVELFLETVKAFGHLYDQTILMGYPPFIKDVIDRGTGAGIDWQDYDLKILTAAEGCSEKFKAYISEKAHLKNPLADLVNIYGTVELGTMAHETPLTNLIRRIASENREVCQSIFPEGAAPLPTLAQYHPNLIYFEELGGGGEVIASGFGSSIPLLRYRFPDQGGVVSYDGMLARLKEAGVDIMREAKSMKLDKMIVRLPFVYVYERSEQAIVISGANVYAEEIKDALHHPEIEDFLTGKFSMIKTEDSRLNQFLEIHIELRKGIKTLESSPHNEQEVTGGGLPEHRRKSRSLKQSGEQSKPSGSGLAKRIEQIIVVFLRANNSEYNDQYSSNPERVTPRIRLLEYRDPKYFKTEGKQKWTIKQT